MQSETIDSLAYDGVVVCLIMATPTRGGVCRVELPASSAFGLKQAEGR